MTEPQRHYANRILDLVPQGNTPPDDTEKGRPIIGDDPLNAFDTYHFQVQADLRAWMTFSPASRYERAEKYAGKKGRAPGADMNKRCKILNYIIWMESHHPLGDSQVAAIAFKGLFPNHVPKPANART